MCGAVAAAAVAAVLDVVPTHNLTTDIFLSLAAPACHASSAFVVATHMTRTFGRKETKVTDAGKEDARPAPAPLLHVLYTPYCSSKLCESH